MDKSLLKKQRVTRYFIDATIRVLKRDGINGVTIRKIAENAGYNSATLYNYFDNLDQLLAFSAIDNIIDYLNDFGYLLSQNKDSLDKYIEIWRCYCHHSFNNHIIYTYAFSAQHSDSVFGQMENYLKIFPNKLKHYSSDIMQLILNSNIKLRDNEIINNCVKDGYFPPESAEYITNTSYLFYHGFMYRMLMLEEKQSPDELLEEFSQYLINFLEKQKI